MVIGGRPWWRVWGAFNLICSCLDYYFQTVWVRGQFGYKIPPVWSQIVLCLLPDWLGYTLVSYRGGREVQGIRRRMWRKFTLHITSEATFTFPHCIQHLIHAADISRDRCKMDRDRFMWCTTFWRPMSVNSKKVSYIYVALLVFEWEAKMSEVFFWEYLYK